MTVGRDETCDIVLNDDKVSRKHAQIQVTKTGVDVEDLSSSNGTWLSGSRINRSAWRPGVDLTIGDCRLELADLNASPNPNQTTVILDQGSIKTVAAHPKDNVTQPSKDGHAPKGGHVPKERRDRRRGNTISRHWNGGFSLGRSIFINTILLSLVAIFIAAALITSVSADGSPKLRLFVVSSIFATTFSMSIWQVVGNLRSLSGAKERGAWRISRWSAALLCALMVLGMPFSIYQFTQTWSSLRQLESNRDENGQPVYALEVSNNILIFRGAVVWPLIDDIKTQLAQNAQVNVLVLDSLGGDATAGRRINDIVRERNMTTAVDNRCASACTVIFVGGRDRVISQNAQLGFHAASIILMDEMMTRIMNVITMRADSLNAQYYRRAGVSEDFIRRAISTPSTELWVPSHNILVEHGVVTRIAR
ncbi:MAG: FHA domain-containing protein [Pseudomonadota bacterium]